jgi:hypothetical protein
MSRGNQRDKDREKKEKAMKGQVSTSHHKGIRFDYTNKMCRKARTRYDIANRQTCDCIQG